MERPYGVALDSTEVEGLAVQFYRRLGFDPETPIDTFRLARKLLGPSAIEHGTAIIGTPAKVFTVRGQRRIAVNRRLSVPYAQFYVGHELGHIVLDEIGYRENDVEQVCDQFGAAVMAPIPAVARMLRAFGRDHEAIADEIGSTQTWAALRIAEYLRIPRAIITPQRLYTRGPEEFVWCPEGELRRLASGKSTPGVTKAKLTDDPRRIVLDVEDLETG